MSDIANKLLNAGFGLFQIVLGSAELSYSLTHIPNSTSPDNLMANLTASTIVLAGSFNVSYGLWRFAGSDHPDLYKNYWTPETRILQNIFKYSEIEEMLKTNVINTNVK